MGYNFVASFI